MTAPVPAVQQLGDALLLQGQAVKDLEYLLPMAVQQAAHIVRRDGIPVPRRWRELLDSVHQAAALARCPPTDVRDHAASPRWVTTAQAAQALGVSERHIRRTAQELDGYRGRGGWLFPTDTIERKRTAA